MPERNQQLRDTVSFRGGLSSGPQLRTAPGTAATQNSVPGSTSDCAFQPLSSLAEESYERKSHAIINFSRCSKFCPYIE